jgi:hypothetical protein
MHNIINIGLNFFKNHQHTFRKGLVYVGVTFLLIVLSFFLFRNSLLNHFASKYTERYSSRFEAKITIEEAEFSGLKTILLKNISISSIQDNDSLLFISHIKANISLWNLLKANIRFSQLEVETLNLQLINKEGQNNFSFLLKKKAKDTESTEKSNPMNYAEVADKMLDLLFDVIPNDLDVNNVSVKLATDSVDYHLQTPNITIHDGFFNCPFSLTENNDLAEWQVEGQLNTRKKTTQLKLYSKNKNTLFPFFAKGYDLKMSADTMYLSLDDFKFKNHQLQLSGKAEVGHFEINHWRISSKNVVLNNSKVNYQVTIGDNYVQLDSTSIVQLNKISFNPFIKLKITKGKELTLNITTPKLLAPDFFESLPTGLFTNLEGLKTKGEVDYRLRFKMDTQQPDSLIFNSTLTPYNFKIMAYGEANLAKLNGEFSYTVYEKDRAVRTFMVGASNPFYTPLDNISPYLKNSIMSSEDGTFYSHKGFNERRFRESIAENYKKKRFVRGASTISMQLVKNVFLRRNKTVARKLEEALLVWLIERNRIVAKSRMYEVYLNLIEFGPNVYGIGEAADFYFKKTPAQLSLEESIFITMIVPRPKWFMYHFDGTGKLKENTAGYYRLIGGIMARNGFITEEQNSTLLPNIVLSPAASSFLVKQDTTVNFEEEIPDEF